MDHERRHILTTVAALGAAGVAVSGLPAQQKQDKDKKDKPEEDVAAAEDLMREHGVLNRVLLIYEEGLRRLHARQEVAPASSQVRHPGAQIRRRTTTRSSKRTSSSPSSRRRGNWWT